MRIEVDDLSRPAVIALVREHLSSMRDLSPPESMHALDIPKLRDPGVTFWTVWEGDLLLGCGALTEVSPLHGEVKSMRTVTSLRRRRVARTMLAHIIGVARDRGYRRLSLETGSGEAFAPAHRLYLSEGFVLCGAFGRYREDPNSVFMALDLLPIKPPESGSR